MTETADVSTTDRTPSVSLLPRVAAVIFSPYKAYAEVAARPRVLGALAVTLLVMITCQTLFLSTDIGKRAMLEEQVRRMEGFGITVTDEMYATLQSSAANAPLTGAVSQIVIVPLAGAIVAGLLFGVFNALLGGAATFKHVYAVVAHSGIVFALQPVFSTPVSYASGEFTGATRLSVFFPMLEEDGALAMLLGSIDLFAIWWLISLAIGLGVLYKRRTGPIAWGLLATYGGLVSVVTVLRTVI